MNAISRHVSRCFFAGIVSLLPIGGLVLTVVFAETSIANSWLKDQNFYFPGLGLLAVAATTYAIGLIVSTFVGRWVWSRIDRLFSNLPALGQLYQTLKQILGCGEGSDALFQMVVLVPSREGGGHEIGLVTGDVPAGEEGVKRQIIFVPAAPNPTVGRLVVMDAAKTRPLDVPVNEALKALISVGKTPIFRDQEGS